MSNLYVKAILVGMFFGIWPLVMNRSGLSGNASSLVLAVVMLGCVLPLSVGDIGSFSNPEVKFGFAVVASLLGVVGILFFNSILASTTPQNVSLFLVLVFIVQIVVPSVYHVVMTGGITVAKGIGFALAVVSAILLIL